MSAERLRKVAAEMREYARAASNWDGTGASTRGAPAV